MCVSPELCECFEGFSKDHSLFTCSPICDGCEHGSCVAPGICKCFEGYKNPEDSNQTCAAHCVKSCVNGFCSSPNTCSCNFGFTKDPQEWNICNAHCSVDCVEGRCTDFNFCQCLPGYKRNTIAWNVCEPYCSHSCSNSICSAPETCKCLWGFKPSNSSFLCELSGNISFEFNFSFESNTEEEITLLLPQQNLQHKQGSLLLQNILMQYQHEMLIVSNCSKSTENEHGFQSNFTFSLYCELERLRNVYSNAEGEAVNFTDSSIAFKNESNFESDILVSEIYQPVSFKNKATEESSFSTEVLNIGKVVKNKTFIVNISLIINLLNFIEREKITFDYFDDNKNNSIVRNWCLCHVDKIR